MRAQTHAPRPYTYRSLMLACACAFATTAAPAAHAQFKAMPSGPRGADLNANQPVTFEADRVSYDREHALVTADGHVEAWQNGHILRADHVSFDKASNTAAASGHVVILEPSGEVLFADYAELTGGMKDGILRAMRAQLAENAKIAANGARRTGGVITDLARVVYSPCNVCANDPTAHPLWQLRAERATRDVQNQRIEYQNMWLDFAGLPVFWFPYFSHTDPSVKRQSGVLVPGIGLSDKHLGSFFTLPYFWVLDDQSDVTLEPLIATNSGPQLEARYRRAFNAGIFYADGAIASLNSQAEGFLMTKGNFAWNDTWRWGFDINLGSSIDYLRDYRVLGLGANVLSSDAFIEGFGVGSYTRLDMRGYQALNTSVQQKQLPYVLPGYQYSFQGLPDVFGGRVRFDTQEFNILRDTGTNDQRVAAKLGWDRMATGHLGDRWQFTVEGMTAAYHASFLEGQPNYAGVDGGASAQGTAQAAVKLNWPFVRLNDDGASQIIEPILQGIIAPQAGHSTTSKLPNEDSLDYEFTDATLFSLNRFDGYDRFDGGGRINGGLRAAWNFAGGAVLDGIIGASWRQHIQSDLYPQFQPWNGFGRKDHLSDIVARTSFVPNDWVDFTLRGRFDHDTGDVRFADGSVSAGPKYLRGSLGYVYSSTNPFFLYTSDYRGTAGTPNLPADFFTPRDEITAGLSTTYGRYSVAGAAQRDLTTGKLVGYGINAKYEDECFVFDLSAARRYTSINYDRGNTVILFTLTFKTIGQVGING